MILPINTPAVKHAKPASADNTSPRVDEASGQSEKQPHRKHTLKNVAAKTHARLKPRQTRRQAKPADKPDDEEQYVYDTSHGYPKGIDGVRLKVHIDGKTRIIKGVPYEDMNKELQKKVDKKPLDDEGRIRVFVHDEIMGLVEFGSDQHAREFKNKLAENGDRLL